MDDRKTLWGIAIHIIEGTIIFLLIAIVAVSLHLLMGWLIQKWHICEYIKKGLLVAEYSVFFTDLLLYLNFLVSTSWKTIQKTWVI